MPTPTFSFRLAPMERTALLQMARIYGAPNPRVFLREMVGAMCSNDEERVRLFLGRLFERVTGQVQLQLEAEARKEIEVRKRALKRTMLPKRRPRARAT